MRLVALLAVLLLASCAPSPPPALFTLAAVAGPRVAASAPSVELRRIGLAGYLDRDTIVLGAADYRLRLAANQQWAEPLGRMLDRVMAEDLASRLPASAVFTESGAIGGEAGVVVELDIRRLDADADGTMVLAAQLALRRGSGGAAPRVETIRLTATPAGPGTADQVAAMSTLLGRLADRIAARIAGR